MPDCGTSACIAGWACVVFPKLLVKDESRAAPLLRTDYGVVGSGAIADIFGLDEYTASRLCHRAAPWKTAKAAAAALEHLAEHGTLPGGKA